MAIAVYTSDLTDIFLFETTTGVAAFGGGASGLGASPDYSIEGTNAVDKQVSAAEKGFLFTAAGAFAIGINDHFYEWVILGVPGLAATRDNRGIQVCIGDSTSAFVKFHVNGVDTLPQGGIHPYCIRFDNTSLTNRRTLVGSPGTSPDSIGCGANVTGTAKFSNLAADAARIGTGYTITGGTGADPEATFAGISTNDAITAEGVILAVDGGSKLQGKLRIGQAGTECEFLDLNTNVFFTDTLDGHALEDLTEIILSDDLSIWTLTNVNFIALGTWNRGRVEMVTPLITAQTHTSYDNSPTTEGTFSGGSGHAVSDVITLDDGWTTVTVDAVSTGAVTQFTVASVFGRSAIKDRVMYQRSSTGSGVDFTLTPDTDNIVTAPDMVFNNVGFIDTSDTVLLSTAEVKGSRWVGADRVVCDGGAVLTDSAIQGFEDLYIITGQDETSYDNNPTTEGTFVAGTGYAVNDLIVLENGTRINVDTLSGSAVATFTVLEEGRRAVSGQTYTQLFASPSGGTGFTLTPEGDNLESASMKWGLVDPSGKLDGMSFSKGTAATHAIEFKDDIPSSITLQDITLTGYNASNGQKDSALWFRDTTGTITVNVSGGTTPSHKSDGATISIVANVTLTFTGLRDNTEIRIYTAGTTTELAGIENATAGSPDARTFAAAIAGGTSVDYVIHNIDYETIRVESFTWPSTNQSLPVAQRFDRNFSNP
jgi:hypothetical protein